MQEIGIVRRIDELGRVVIPKEIRKTLRIREGDPLEIYTNKEELVFRKYSPIATLGDSLKTVADALEEMLGKTCYITDTDSVLYASNSKPRACVGKKLSAEAQQTITDRKSVIACKMKGTNPIKLCSCEEFNVENQIFVPIISAGDCYGAVVVCDKDKNACFTSYDEKLVQMGAIFLAKHFE